MALEPQSTQPLPDARREAVESDIQPAMSPETAAASRPELEQPDVQLRQKEMEHPVEGKDESLTWTSEGGMVQQQTSAMEWVKANEAASQTGSENQSEPTAAPEASQTEISSRDVETPVVESDKEGATEMTDARAARAEQLATLVDSQEKSQESTLEVGHSQEQ